ncbi:hypothetical protein AXG93_1952s1080 [Marchantia polymorpha subsp. ruderalis]|uniref:Uncharacterized protein n=1 Tax=Marchantia polymorpha subsp. ruderalis TaxID=1480154 RepID=A0A176WNR7_MARPO|nr:hypothetical protein AXG93_1952s1080 [Marchantia polymorpha subsp. ruderalis]
MRDKGPTEKQRGWHNKSLATATPKNNGRLVDTRAVTPRSNLNSGGKVDDTGKNPKQKESKSLMLMLMLVDRQSQELDDDDECVERDEALFWSCFFNATENYYNFQGVPSLTRLDEVMP